MSSAELPPILADAVLSANFDPLELHNRLNDLGLAPAEPGEAPGATARLLRTTPRLAAHFDAYLDRLHRESLSLTWEADEEALLRWCHRGDYRRCHSLGGMLWALARDPRHRVVDAACHLARRIVRDSLAWTRGSANGPGA